MLNQIILLSISPFQQIGKWSPPLGASDFLVPQASRLSLSKYSVSTDCMSREGCQQKNLYVNVWKQAVGESKCRQMSLQSLRWISLGLRLISKEEAERRRSPDNERRTEYGQAQAQVGRLEWIR
ncbi:unnamed protein product [Paramecium pentaurelia]|uniref:Uncharacterized protein n=1 Tax=Paramecium pentaurelia TaxID=43138 RepID=A0A8S1VZ39_9CILI|nr:unnamed protein product [Paramecium pentaurelia]